MKELTQFFPWIITVGQLLFILHQSRTHKQRFNDVSKDSYTAGWTIGFIRGMNKISEDLQDGGKPKPYRPNETDIYLIEDLQEFERKCLDQTQGANE